jgi:Protein of unknown function (DUF3800)
MVLNAYIDGSGTGDPKHLVLAGYIATADIWIEFSKDWKAQLDEAKLPYFKMHEQVARPEIAAWFYRLIEKHDIKAAISCVIHTDELVRVNRSIKYPPHIINTEQIENPYYFGFKAIIDVLAQNQQKLGISGPVNFIFDEESEKERVLQGWELMKAASSPEIAKLYGETPAYQNDKKIMPLQAADLYAWWILKWEREGLIEAVRDLPFAWETKKNIARLAMRFRERDFLIETANGLARHARSKADLDYAESLVPPPLSSDDEQK